MFSGLANYLFGSTNSDTGNNICKENDISENQEIQQPQQQQSNNNLQPIDELKFLSIETEEDDWLIVDRDGEEGSLPRTDSEEELPFVEIKKSPKRSRNYRGGSGGHYQNVHLTTATNYQQQQQQRQQRHNNDGVSQALHVVQPQLSNALVPTTTTTTGIVHLMEESWFLTPPPCFTSTGPVNMETSPFENLLIEHPSMSVYHSIRSAQEAAESFVDLDHLGIEEESQVVTDQIAADAPIANNNIRSPARNVPAVQRNNSNRVEHLTNQQVKQNILLRNSQKDHEKKERQNNCRSAMKRGNKVRDFNSSKGGRKRRSDQQHCKIISGANNNRKC